MRKRDIAETEYVLITESWDYADEFNIGGFTIMPTVEWKELIHKIKLYESSLFSDCEFYFGTNECIIIQSFDEFLEGIDVQNITKQEYDIINELFGESYETTFLERLQEYIYSYEYSEDEDENKEQI